MNSSLEPERLPGGADNASAGDAAFASARDALNAARPVRNPRLREAATALAEGRREFGEGLLSRFLEKHPRDVDALNLMGEAAMRALRYEEAEALLAQCVALAPDFIAARFNYANALYRLTKTRLAMVELDELLKKEPLNPLYLDLKSALLAAMGNFEESMVCRAQLCERYPDSARQWLQYGHSLRNLGLRERSIDAYRRAIALSPAFGSAYWSLANLKTFRFTDDEIEVMQAQLARTDLEVEDRATLHYSLGKAYGDRELTAKAFENYARANAMLRLGVDYNADWTTARVANFEALFTREFFRARTGTGSGAADPIFIVGMQRAGSTLIEQILASHSAIEGAGELTDLAFIARELIAETGPDYIVDYTKVLRTLDPAALRALGEQYLDSTRSRRNPGRPRFTDKQPYNFWHAGLIHLILPNARIVDVRRHPLACCFSNFSQRFTTDSTPFTHRLSDIGRYYADYVRLMAHFDRVLPGKVHRVIYERLIENPEREVRSLLDHLGLPFEDSCLQFHKTERAFDSASSEQVRMPIFDEGVDRWRRYEPWLGPLKAALGPVLEAYPAVPGSES